MINFIQYFKKLLFISALLAFLVSCGGSAVDTTNSSNIAQGKGTVGILITDKPADPSTFSSINASIEKVELIPSAEGDKVVLYEGETQTFDLLRLRNESIPLTFNDEVPSGEYCKIRLTLSDLELVLADDTPNDPGDNETDHPKLPGNGKLDLVVRDCFVVAVDEVVTIQIDFDAGKSIHINENKKGFKFRPVIFVDVLSSQFDGKLVRLSGEITEVDPENNSLLLCDAIPNETMKNLGCINVHFNEDSAFFDNVEYDGAPRAIEELLSDDKLGQSLSVVGWPKYVADDDPEEDQEGQYIALMQLQTLVAELGEFLAVEGEVAVDADTTGFSMTVSSGGPIITEDMLAVMFQNGASAEVNGTRLVSKSGQILQPEEIVQPLPVQIDGTLLLVSGSDPVLKAALVILDKSALGSEQVTGSIIALEPGLLTLTPEVDIVCGEATAQLLVILADELDILTVTITDDSSEITQGGTLEVGQIVGINGSCEVGGFETDNVVIVDDQRV